MMRLFFWIGKTRSGAVLIGFVFEHLTTLLPVKRYYEDNDLIAFKHPQSCYPLHILIVPKRRLAGIDELTELDTGFFFNLINCVNLLIEKMGLREGGYQLILNGGSHQVIPQLHFHLIAE